MDGDDDDTQSSEEVPFFAYLTCLVSDGGDIQF